MIIFGLRATNIGSLKIENSECQYCENKGTQNITDFGRYFHIFWIPVFPVGRKTYGECTHCKRTLKKSEFNPKLKKQYSENKSIIKRPVWHWSGLILIGLLFTISFIMAMTN